LENVYIFYGYLEHFSDFGITYQEKSGNPASGHPAGHDNHFSASAQLV
jgi:hypothetical protein